MKKFASLAMAGTLAMTMLGTAAFAGGQSYTTSYEDRNGVRWYPNYGYDRGYRDGMHSGHGDAEKGYRFRAEDHGQFRSGSDGYDGRGSKDEYKEAYRAGYMKGYKQAYGETMKSFGYRQVR